MRLKPFRVSTLMLLVVIAALSAALVEQGRRAARREAMLEARLAEANAVVAERYALGILHIGEETMVKPREKSQERAGR